MSNLFDNSIEEKVKDIVSAIKILNLDERIAMLNYVRSELHKVSPFKNEPIDFVEWVKNETVHANDYNPNSVAPPEMKLLQLSIDEDGYTQPIVSQRISDNEREVVDGFHRNRVGKEVKKIREKVFGYLPVVSIREDKTGKQNRIASTIRHNRARGTHAIKGMSSIVLELIDLGWDDAKIAKHLGMEAEEVLRLKQISGLPQAFANHQFSKSWEEFESKFNKKNNE
ncbi:IbrB-like domain-containing protein [Riemerella anatipestifer]|uniref:IbrB-like domain-containing protein n=1 Tax=Riemerella anatipestifer TaxID=34085 RepID=UPI001373048C|nr:ParB/RepB/Spo0J family partition protein [Riemerella anatipestifer]MCW0517942.1 ParB/RepB/Spo0J family partition protein [Riemerella anatipestifer]MDY3344374.1 ParB/RepB/Spo0J family partition protein [Riemerella anatipestifer]MDY3357454.1 ParB/RepB/Spo0J family partition protein [Riemerella anatipestifer]NAV16709.1 hypothetical protein [Riemerella anatipestifer]